MVSRKEAGTILKNLRISANMTRADIADLLCVTESAVAKYEEGKNNVPPDSICLYAGALNVDVMDLLRLTGHMPADLPTPVWKENGRWRIVKERKEKKGGVMDKKITDIKEKAIKDGLSDRDLMELVEDIIRNTNMDGEEAFSADRIRVEISVLTAVVMYIFHYTTYECHTIEKFGRLLVAGMEDDEAGDGPINTPMQYIFNEVEEHDSEAAAIVCYKTYMAAPKYLRRTALSCLISRLRNPRFPAEFWDRYFEDFDEERAEAEERAAREEKERERRDAGNAMAMSMVDDSPAGDEKDGGADGPG